MRWVALARAAVVAATLVLLGGASVGPPLRRRAIAHLNATASLPLLATAGHDWQAQERGLRALDGLASHARHAAGWRAGTQFAAFWPHATLSEVLAAPLDFTGAFLAVVPGNASFHPLRRRPAGMPFVSIAASRAAQAHLAPWVPTAPLNAAAEAAERLLGRRLFAFELDVATLVPCRSGVGPCAVWEANTGHVVLDSGLAAEAMGTGQGLTDAAASFAEQLASHMAAAARLLDAAAPPAARDLAAVFSRGGAAAAAAAAVALAGALPAWWCIACATVLGLLAPFVFNFGLTAAADALCSSLHLPSDTCADLWWGAFALALVLSLGSAVPIVYICRLPDCIKHLRTTY